MKGEDFSVSTKKELGFQGCWKSLFVKLLCVQTIENGKWKMVLGLGCWGLGCWGCWVLGDSLMCVIHVSALNLEKDK
jgi:hypothetical protein